MIQKLKMNYLITLNYHNTKYMIEIDMRELRYFLGNNDNSIILKLQKTIPEIVINLMVYLEVCIEWFIF